MAIRDLGLCIEAKGAKLVEMNTHFTTFHLHNALFRFCISLLSRLQNDSMFYEYNVFDHVCHD